MIVRDSGPHVRRIEQLEDELEIARDRIKELESALGIGDDIMPLRLLGLTTQEARIVNLLRRRDVVTREQMLIAVYADDEDRRFDVTPRVVDVLAAGARKKLRKVGVTFGSIFKAGGGTSDGAVKMPGPDKVRLAKLLASNAQSFVSGSSIKRKSRRHVRSPDGRFNRGVESRAMNG